MARVNLGKVVPEKGVDYYTEAEKIALKQEIENDLSTQINKNKTDIQTLQTESGNSIEMSLDRLTYKLTLKLKNKAGQQISSQEIDLPNENSITDISYNNGKLTLTKQSGATTEVDISGLINGLATETALNNLANALKETIGIQTNTYNESQTYNTGDIVVQNEKIYKANQDNITGTFDSSKWDEISLYEYQKIQDEAIEENYKVITKLQEDVEDLTERMEDAENNEMTYTPTPATSHYLQDSADARFRNFLPIGRTTQESTTGKNLIDYTKAKSGGSTTITLIKNGFNAKGYYAGQILVEGLEENTGYYLSYIRETISGNETSISVFAGTTQTTQIANFSGNGSFNTVNNTTVNIWFYVSNGSSSGEANFTNIQLEKGSTATSYEPYTGGIPAPNPKYPFPIKNTGDNGSVNEKVQNKNILSSENIDTTLASVTYKSQNDGTILANGTKYGENYSNFTNNTVTLETDTYSSRIFLLDGTIKKDGNDYKPEIYLINQDDNTKSYSISEIGNPGRTKNIEAGTYFIRIALWNDNVVFTNAKIGLMLVKGSTIPDEFIPHAEQNPSFPLAEGQKFYEGSHPDDDEKVHHKWGEVVLDGTENWEQTSTATSGKYRWLLNVNNVKATSSTSEIPEIFSTHYKAVAFGGGNGTYNNVQGISVANYGSKIGIYDNTYNTDLTAWKAYLAEQYANGTPVKVIYPLAEEQTEDFTEEQKTAWKEWKKARTYKNITHISSEDETPANVEVEYVVDINTIDDRITALESRVDLLEE